MDDLRLKQVGVTMPSGHWDSCFRSDNFTIKQILAVVAWCRESLGPEGEEGHWRWSYRGGGEFLFHGSAETLLFKLRWC